MNKILLIVLFKKCQRQSFFFFIKNFFMLYYLFWRKTKSNYFSGITYYYCIGRNRIAYYRACPYFCTTSYMDSL